MRQLLLVCFIFTVSIFMLTYCTSDKAFKPEEKSDSPNDSNAGDSLMSTCDTLQPSFQQAIKPIFTNNCALSGCHDENTGKSGYVLEKYNGIKEGVQNGKVLCSIKHESDCYNMPQGSDQLSQTKIQRIECWSENGAPNN